MTTGSECLQGETLEQQFGEQEVCFRTLDLYTSAVLESTLNPVVPPKEEFRSAMEVMAKVCIFCMMPYMSLRPPGKPAHCCIEEARMTFRLVDRPLVSCIFRAMIGGCKHCLRFCRVTVNELECMSIGTAYSKCNVAGMRPGKLVF